VRRQLGASASKAEMRRALREGLRIYQDGNKITASIGRRLPFLPLEDLKAFFSVATSLGLEPVLTGANPHPPGTHRKASARGEGTNV
jgi:hypothetical protein